jgi:hypothetical protein
MLPPSSTKACQHMCSSIIALHLRQGPAGNKHVRTCQHSCMHGCRKYGIMSRFVNMRDALCG